MSDDEVRWILDGHQVSGSGFRFKMTSVKIHAPLPRVGLLALPLLLLAVSWAMPSVFFTGDYRTFVEIYQLLVLLLVPGWYLSLVLFWRAGLGVTETIAIDLAGSLALVMAVAFFLSFLRTQISRPELSTAILASTCVFCLVLLYNMRLRPLSHRRAPLIGSLVSVACLIAVFAFGFYVESLSLPSVYWHGYDPWINAPIAGAIAQGGLTPSQVTTQFSLYNVAISGFYYLTAAIGSFTGIPLYSVTRLGGPTLAGIVGVMSFSILERYAGRVAAGFGTALLYFNPFFNLRFSMDLRENLAFVFLLGIVLLLGAISNDVRNGKTRASAFVALGIFLGASLASHPLEATFAMGLMILYLLATVRSVAPLLNWALAFVVAVLLSFPFGLSYFGTLYWVWLHWMLPLFSVFLLPLFVVALVFIFAGYVLLQKSRTGVLVPLSIMTRQRFLWVALGSSLLIGMLDSILFPRSFAVLGSYNPSVTVGMFATTSLVLGISGFVAAVLRKSEIPLPVWLTSLVLVLPFDLAALGAAFPLFRVVIYLSWVLSFGTAVLLREVLDSNRGAWS